MAEEKWRSIFDYRLDEEELVLRFHRPDIEVIPKEARQHLWAAQKEFLLALRALFDAIIEGVEARERRQAQGRRKKIPVE